jgi:hypothetical protein
MDEMLHGFSPSHMFSHINHNHISYLNQINSLGFSIRVWGFLPPSTIPYGTVDGADTIHPAFYHGSTCLRNSNRQLSWFLQSKPDMIGCVQLSRHYAVISLVIKLITDENYYWKAKSVSH